MTFSHIVPTMFVRWLKLPPDTRARYDVSSLRHVLHGAAPCPPDVKRRMIEWLGPIVQEYYASTAANGATMISAQQWLPHPGVGGRPLIAPPLTAGDHGAALPTREERPRTV